MRASLVTRRPKVCQLPKVYDPRNYAKPSLYTLLGGPDNFPKDQGSIIVKGGAVTNHTHR
jgi:hypothetical protein